MSLARALVKNSKIIILDEATGMRIFIVQHRTRSHGSLKTASVDYETDHKIQDTIANEFKDRTILCIARALNTVVPEVSLTDTNDRSTAHYYWLRPDMRPRCWRGRCMSPRFHC